MADFCSAPWPVFTPPLTFIDKIKANGELKKIYDKWMKVPVPEFPKSLEGLSFTAN